MGIHVRLLYFILSFYSVLLGGRASRLESRSRSLFTGADEAFAPGENSGTEGSQDSQDSGQLKEADSSEGTPADDSAVRSMSASSAMTSYFGGSGGAPAEEAPGRFVDAFIAGFWAASNGVKSKRFRLTRDPRSEVVIKTWYDLNSMLSPTLKGFIARGFGEDTIESMRPRLERKFGAASDAGASKSGATLYMLPFDEKTGASYILKGEDRTFVRDGVMPIIKPYGMHTSPEAEESLGPCEKSTMMKVLFVFEPQNVHKLVDKQVWMLFTNINPIPMVAPHNNVQLAYDIKHSRPINRCSSIGEEDASVGYFGDFLRIWGKSLKNAILDEQARGEMMTARDGKQYLKSTCFLKAAGHDLAVLDSDYPRSKLVDQSALIMMVQLRDESERPRSETQAEKEIIDGANNIFRVWKDGEQWLAVVGLIDLFANKNARAQNGKKWQSYMDSKILSKDFLLDLDKFAMYPFQLGCVMQYIFYYSKSNFKIAGNDTNYLVITDNRICSSFPFMGNVGVLDRVDENIIDPLMKTWGHRKMSDTLHEAVKREQACTLVKACNAVLFTQQENFRTCCKNGRQVVSLDSGSLLPQESWKTIEEASDANADCDY